MRSPILKKLENLVKVDEFLHTYDLNRSITTSKIKAGITFKEEAIFFFNWVVVECLPHSFECQSLDL